MPKSINHIFVSKLKFKKMLSAYERASKNKHSNKEVILFEMDLATNLTNLLKEIYYGKYKVGRYREFYVYIPKKRVIRSLPFRDRVIHQWYVEEFIKPVYVPKMINDTFSCLEDRGTLKAVHKLQKYMRLKLKENPNYYVLKCDINKYFDSINKEILLKMLQRNIRDKYFLAFTRKLLYDNNEQETGIPIGNYTSQFFANIYLNVLDHYVKEVLRIKYYIRYMDDFILLVDSKAEAREIKEKIENFIQEKLKLKFNQKTNYFKNSQGVSFCGYRVFHDKLLLRSSNKKRMYGKVNRWKKLYSRGKLDCISTCKTLASWEGYASHARTANLMKKIYDRCEWIYQ